MNTLRESCHMRINRMSLPSDTAIRLFYYIQWTGHFICKPDFFIRRSGFESFLLLYTVHGSGILHYDGRSFRLTENTAALIDCTRLHEYYPEADRWEFRYVHFLGASSKELAAYIAEIHGTPVIDGAAGISESLAALLTLVLESGTEPLCSDQIFRMLMQLCAAGEKKVRESDSRIQNALSYIRENYSRPIHVNELADAAHLSRCHFSVAFKTHTGSSPYRYILRFRLAAAKQLLCSTEKTVDEIAEQCGFADPTTFIRAFRRETGRSPTAFRRAD